MDAAVTSCPLAVLRKNLLGTNVFYIEVWLSANKINRKAIEKSANFGGRMEKYHIRRTELVCSRNDIKKYSMDS